MPIALEQEPDNVFRVEMRGLLRKADLDACQARLVAEMGRLGPVRLLFVLDGFEGWEPRDNWSDLTFYAKYSDRIDLPSGGTILVYQPQVASWEKQTHLVAYSAVSQRAKSAEKPAIGTIKIEADTQVSVPERLVSFQKMKIVEANFQTLQKEQIRVAARSIS